MTDLVATLTQSKQGLVVEDDFEKINALFLERGWSDGLPVVPPTTARVEQMLQYCDRRWDEPIATLGPRNGDATPLRIAANAVMAGCRPEYFPLLCLAIETMCEKQFNLSGIQTTTHDAAPLMIVNGPIARELRINCGYNAFGPGTASNATIGRAIRLALVNIGGAVPGAGDMSTFGSPAKYTYCVAENEADSPWEPLHVERGFPAEATTVTMVGADCPHNINDHESVTAEGVLKTIAGSMGMAGANDVHHEVAHPIVVMGPEHARTVANGGYSKYAAKQFLQQNANLPLHKFAPENIERRLNFFFNGKYRNATPDTLVPMLQRPEDLILLVIGGAGKHSAYIPSFGATLSVTRALTRKNGEFAKSIEEFRQQ